ncbi:Structural maintenance of chromosomes protein 6 [Modicella reniformis]|uniref:Structural maintenance of chromosomes protein 6 n=1 Tax=Modicella reniformis TaxID=1440133 RepID=A0A9P6M2C2_9FUNG|nr:Structural maintenance of chromosomes protein 6 [Modicella reniformis]
MTEPRKRRLIQEEEDEDDKIYPHASAAVNDKRTAKNLKEKGVKRVKRQAESEEEQEQIVDEEENEENDIYREEPQGWDVDINDNETSEDMNLEERAELEFKKSKAQRGRHGLVAEMGVIELIEMFDFMCHRHLKVSFGPKINFIIGHNGSGKSAILTAIMVCLGGKATVTNRAQSLKALIREGASQAEVKLQLRNKGPDAYKPEIYGESIIIERRISKDGTSAYKIKSSKGKTIATKREELSAICDHMNIQIDNPMNVLSQDTARQFLQSSTPEDKYKFFGKGTQLTQLSIDYETVRECIDTMQGTIKSKIEILPELHELAKAAQARFKDSQQAVTLELKVENLKSQVAWAQIEDLERGVKQTQKSLDTLSEKIPAIEKKRASEEETIAELDEKIRGLERTTTEHAISTAPAQEKKRQLEHDLREQRNELKGVQEEERTVNEEIKAFKEQIRGYDQDIERETRKLQANTQSRRAEIENKIEKLHSEIDQSKRQYAEGKETYSTLDHQLEERRDRLELTGNAVRKAKLDLKETTERIRQLQDQKQNSLKAFGPTIPEVLQAIQEITTRRGWKGVPPVGPLGRHVKLREQDWAQVIESALGNVLNGFAVTVDADRSTLYSILKKHRCNSDIILTKKIIFDYRDKEPSSHFLTMNRVLDFDDEWVRRLLIDKSSIESTILVEKRSDADRITSSGRDGGFPENVTGCFTIDLFRVGDRSGGASSLMMNKYRGPPRLSKNTDQELGTLEGDARQFEDKLRYRVRESKTIMTEVDNMDRERLEIKKQLANLEKDIRLKTRAAEGLQESLQEDEPTNLHAYEDSRQQTLEQIEQMKKQYEPIALRKQTVISAMEPIREQIIQLNDSIKSQESDTVKIRNELDKLNIEKQGHIPKIQHWNKKLEAETAAVRELGLELKTKTKYLKESTAKATEYCERVEVTATTAQLEREIKHIQERLREQEAQRGCSVEEIEKDMRQKLGEYKSAKHAIQQLQHFVSHLKTTLHQRLSRWREFRAQMALRAKINFSLQLSERAYSGELTFQHPEKRLSIRVETEDQRTGKTSDSKDKDPKSLSGGEKSFSTICLLLALWDCMSCSIRCLDEFDVFMDAVNRRISMKMLIDFARESDGVQYILITPQDASSVSPGPDVLFDFKGTFYTMKRQPEDQLDESSKRRQPRTWKGCSQYKEFELVDKLGEGTFGEVHKARRKGSGELLALKRILMHNENEGIPITALREIKILKRLKHDNIVPLHDIAVQPGSRTSRSRASVYMVFPYMDHDLSGLLNNPKVRLSVPQIKLYMKQLLEGTIYMHSQKILHRDMKAANLLISNDGTLKIADFGLARPFKPEGEDYTSKVVTRWYRPPELFLGEKKYGPAVDMWGIGCVFGEMLFGRPVLQGNSDQDQLDKIFQLCGSPTEDTMPGWSALPGLQEENGVVYQVNRNYQRKLKEAFEPYGTLAADLMDKLLVLDPKKRLTAMTAADHDYLWVEPLPAEIGK